MKPFDNYEIHGCCLLDCDYTGIPAPSGATVEQCDDAKAEFWTLYGHLPEGGLEAIGDFKSRKRAEEVFERITGQRFGSHEENAATARAMVMARELLEALEGLAENSCTLRPMEFRRRLDRSYAVIAEATGRAA